MDNRWMGIAAASACVCATTACGLTASDAKLGEEASGSGGGIALASGVGGNIDLTSGSGGGCNELTVEFEKQVPTVLLLIDRSSSMFDNAYGSSPDRWQPLYDALVDPNNGLVKQLDSEVRFGLATYTNNGHGGTCPIMSEVAPKLGNYASVKSAYDQESSKPNFKGETPTGPAVLRATEILKQVAEPGPKYIILATDGEPDTCGHPDPQCGQDESITAVQAAYDAGIGTIVIGIGGEVGVKHLRDLANAGDGQTVEEPDQSWIYTCLNSGISAKNASYVPSGGDANYYQPADQSQLEVDLHGIIIGVRDCVFKLKAKVDVDQAYLCKVELDGNALPHNTSWKLKSDTELEITGTACDDLKTVSKAIHIDCPCDVVEPL
jgi:hypothetical protein